MTLAISPKRTTANTAFWMRCSRRLSAKAERLSRESANLPSSAEEHRRRKRDASRWRRFRDLAQDWHELSAVRDFLVALRSMDFTTTAEIDGRSVEE